MCMRNNVSHKFHIARDFFRSWKKKTVWLCFCCAFFIWGAYLSVSLLSSLFVCQMALGKKFQRPFQLPSCFPDHLCLHFNWNVVKICHIIMTVGTMKCDQRCMCSFKCGQLTSKLSSLTELIIALREFSTPGLICGFIMATRAVKPQWQSVLLHFRCCDTFSIVQVWVFAHWTIPRLPPFLPLSRVLLFGIFQCWVLFMALLPFLHHASFSSATSFFFFYINLKLLQFLLLADSLAVMDFK